MILIDDQKLIMAGDAVTITTEVAILANKLIQKTKEAYGLNFDKAFEMLAERVYEVKNELKGTNSNNELSIILGKKDKPKKDKPKKSKKVKKNKGVKND